MIVVTTVINVNIATRESGLSDISLANVEALAIELPEVVITCGQSQGACWDIDCLPAYTPFGPFGVIYCKNFTGYMRDFCDKGAPCYW